MKAKSILAALALVLTLTAQRAAATEGSRSHFGVRAALDMTTSHNDNELVGWGPGVSVGGIYYAPFGKMTYFNAGVLFSYATLDFSGTGGSKYNRVTVDGDITVIGLKMPLDVGLRILRTDKLCLSAYTGPHLYFNFSTKGSYDETRGSSTTHIDKKFTNSGMEIGWGLGVGLDLWRHWHVHIEGVYGLSGMMMFEGYSLNKEGEHLKRAEISVGVGYNF